MKKFTFLLAALLIASSAFPQGDGVALTGIQWIAWHDKGDWGENPYDHATYTVLKAPAAWSPISSAAEFDATWDLLGDANYVANITNDAGGDLFDLGAGNTFGATWKAVHDGNIMYVLLKYYDVDEQVDQASLSFEIMAQPTSPVRHEPTFVAAQDSAEHIVAYKNQAYARVVELGGGKAVFADGMAAQYEAARGTHRAMAAWAGDYWQSGQWVNNEFGLMALLDLADEGLMFWEKADGVIRAVFPMDFAGVLSYPADPAGDIVDGDRVALQVGETFAFDIKSNALVGEDKVEYFWSADQNDGYGANYYSGHLTVSPNVLGEDPGEAGMALTGIQWIAWHDKEDWGENPYDNVTYTVYQAPASWSPVSSVAEFDATWGLLGDANYVSNLTDGAGGDLFDLGAGNTFGAAWKAVHDGSKMYVLLEYYDVDQQVDQASLSFEIMAQPTSPVRHEPTFVAAQDSAANVMAYKNQAYARVVELGGGKAVFADGMAAQYEAARGTHRAMAAWAGDYWQSGQWVNNEFALMALLDLADEGLMFWEKVDGVIKAVFPMDFDGVLSYPVDPAGDIVDGPRVSLQVGETFAFDIKSNALIGENKVEYFWSADHNDGYGANYYSGHLTISPEVLGDTPGDTDVALTGIQWIAWHDKGDWGAEPYDNLMYTIYKAPASWNPVSSVAEFDATWDILGDANYVANLTDGAGGDLFDLGTGNTFGAAWKAVHDGSNVHVLLKYYDVDEQVDQASLGFEIMAQPTSYFRHEPTFVAAQDSAEHVVAYKNQAYARVVELGGGKAVFADGMAAQYEAARGTHRAMAAWAGDYWQSGQWVNNEFGLMALLDLADEGLMFWDHTDGVIRGVFPMDFAGVLSYPADPAGDIVDGTRIAFKVGETFAFDVKSNALIGENKVEYFWSANHNDGYGSNYYSGHVTVSPEELTPTSVPGSIEMPGIRVYVYDQILHVTGDTPVDIEVFNMLGARVKSAQNVQQLSLSDLNNGIYIVRIPSEQQAFKVVKY